MTLTESVMVLILLGRETVGLLAEKLLSVYY